MTFRFQSELFNSYHDLMQKSYEFSQYCNCSAKGNKYKFHFWCISKDETINVMLNASFAEKIEYYKIKMDKRSYKFF